MADTTQNDAAIEQYNQKFGNKIPKSLMLKKSLWPKLQELGHAGNMKNLKKDFLGLKDYGKLENIKASGHWILKLGWNLIKQMAMQNAMIALQMIQHSVLGPVGNMLSQMGGFAETFSVDIDQLRKPGAVEAKIASASSTVAGSSQQPAVGGAPVPIKG